MQSVKQGVIFLVFAMTRPGIEPRSTVYQAIGEHANH